MHELKASALCNLERYCSILMHTLKHLKPAKCVINITYKRPVQRPNAIYILSYGACKKTC